MWSTHGVTSPLMRSAASGSRASAGRQHHYALPTEPYAGEGPERAGGPRRQQMLKCWLALRQEQEDLKEQRRSVWVKRRRQADGSDQSQLLVYG